MRSELEYSDITYVLLGKEGIMLYKTSVKALLNSDGVNYKVGAYNSVKKFMNDTKLWGDFIEISKEDFLLLKKHLRKSEKSQKKGRVKFFNMFK